MKGESNMIKCAVILCFVLEKIYSIFPVIIGIVLLILIIFAVYMYISRQKLQKEEQEVARLNQIAEEANEIKSRFLANMSYNIRIPLNNVVGFSQLLSTDSELSESEKLEYSTIIRENTTELIQLVNDVLDLSRLEAQMMKFQIQDCEIREMCNDLIYMAQMNSKEHIRIELETDVESLWFKTDANRFNQAVLSMLVYPVAQEAERDIKIQLNKEEEKGLLVFHITNSPLSDPAFASQKVFVRHRINQLLFEHFGGSYVVSPNSEDGYLITFTISFRIE